MSGPSPPSKGVERFREDRWNTDPPQVASYLTCPKSEPSDDLPSVTYISPNCGFGWRFQFIERFGYQKSRSIPRVQELVGHLEVTFQPHECSLMPLSNFKVNVKVSYPTDEAKSIHEEVFTNVSIKGNSKIGTYTGPPQYKGQMHIEVTLTFSPSDGLSLPTTPPINTRIALHHSLDGPSFVDTKFYLFSAKVQGRPAIPKVVFARSTLLTDTSSYLHDLLTPGAGFVNGTLCDLHRDVPEEVAKLDPDAFEYDSDSDLEDNGHDEGLDPKDKGKAPEVPSAHTGADPVEHTGPSSAVLQNGRAFAINGTAYKTWKAFIFYTYLNDIQFSEFKSQRGTTEPSKLLTRPGSDITSCSPKSMYRFADYAGIPQLKSLAKEGIRKNLSKTNIVAELFSNFTSKYQEIIDLEVEYLVANLTYDVARELDEMLQLVVMGAKPHCFRVLAFSMRRLRGESGETAWGALDNDIPVSLEAGLAGSLSKMPTPQGTRTGSPLQAAPRSLFASTPSVPKSIFAKPTKVDDRVGHIKAEEKGKAEPVEKEKDEVAFGPFGDLGGGWDSPSQVGADSSLWGGPTARKKGMIRKK